MKYPDGTFTDPTLGPVVVNPPPGWGISRVRTQSVPADWPWGDYVYFLYAADSFFSNSTAMNVSKLAVSDNSPSVWDASCTGEPFPGGEFPPLLRGDRGDLVTASPNPFNPTTTISFKLQAASYVSLKIYDISGRLVMTLADGWQEAGTQEVTFDGSGLASGIYLYVLSSAGQTITGKMTLLK
jgi:hypothetical protein